MRNKLLFSLCIVQVMLVIFKLFDLLAWAWWIILLPVIIPVGAIIGFAIVLSFAINQND